MIRTAIIILYVLPATAVLSMIAIIVAFFSRTGNPVHIIARMWSKSILFVSGIKVDVKGLVFPFNSDGLPRRSFLKFQSSAAP
jgi:hypothetical protein